MSESIYKILIKNGMSHYGACSVIGNLEAESALKANNLQNTFEKSGVSDEVYTLAVDNGLYKNFINDQAGYGLAQWTHPGRKRQLLEFVNNANASIGDETTQVNFLVHEMRKDYPNLFEYLCSVGADGFYSATSRVCKEYERPAINNVDARYAYAQRWERFYVLNGIADLDGAEQAPETGETTEDVLDVINSKLDKIINLLEGEI